MKLAPNRGDSDEQRYKESVLNANMKLAPNRGDSDEQRYTPQQLGAAHNYRPSQLTAHATLPESYPVHEMPVIHSTRRDMNKALAGKMMNNVDDDINGGSPKGLTPAQENAVNTLKSKGMSTLKSAGSNAVAKLNEYAGQAKKSIESFVKPSGYIDLSE